MKDKKHYSNIDKIIDKTQKKMKNYTASRIMEIITNLMMVIMFGLAVFAFSSILAAEERNKVALQKIERYIELERQSNWVKAQSRLNRMKWEKENSIKNRLESEKSKNESSLYLK